MPVAIFIGQRETIDLEVPADAEIVLEGHIPPNYCEEGPFSDFQDYYVTGAGKNPIVEYQYMTRRHDAIFKSLQNGSEIPFADGRQGRARRPRPYHSGRNVHLSPGQRASAAAGRGFHHGIPAQVVEASVDDATGRITVESVWAGAFQLH